MEKESQKDFIYRNATFLLSASPTPVGKSVYDHFRENKELTSQLRYRFCKAVLEGELTLKVEKDIKELKLYSSRIVKYWLKNDKRYS